MFIVMTHTAFPSWDSRDEEYTPTMISGWWTQHAPRANDGMTFESWAIGARQCLSVINEDMGEEVI